MDTLASRVVADLSPSDLHTFLRLANLYLEAGWMTEREGLVWRRAIVARMDLEPVTALVQ